MYDKITSIVDSRFGKFKIIKNDIFISKSMELYGEWSFLEIELLNNFIKDGSVVLEGGSNIGSHTIPFSFLVKSGKVLAFEPNPFVFSILDENIANARCNNVILYNKALGDKNGLVWMPRLDYEKNVNAGASEASYDFPENQSNFYQIEVITVDSLRLEKLDVLKADVEGFEVNLINGARETINRCRPILYLENDRDDKSEGLIKSLLELDYDVYWHFPPMYNPNNFKKEKLDFFSGKISINILGIPKEKSIKINLPKITTAQESWRDVLKRLKKEEMELENYTINKNLLNQVSNINVMLDFNLRIISKQYLNQLNQNPAYKKPGRLEPYEYKVYSKNGEDGIIHEIFNRIGTKEMNFFEIGIETGIECNTHFLLACGWEGVWVEGSQNYAQQAYTNFKHYIEAKKLEVINSFVTRDNINQLLIKAQKEIDLLSIDIDGNDFYIWQAIDDNKFRPRVVIIEYNGSIPGDVALVQPYIENFRWNGSNDSGSSLKALEILGRKKGYYLVGTNILGVNAFFVREDLWSAKLFANPPTSENLYNPARYELFLAGAYKVGHRPSPSKFISINELE